jgi:hypothetical protein
MLERFHNGMGYFSFKKKIDQPGFYKIKFKSNKTNIPILPVKNLKLLFPEGTNVGTY